MTRNWNIRIGASFAADVDGFMVEPMQIGRRVELQQVRFHLTNFPDYIGMAISAGGSTRAGRVEAAWNDDWEMRIDNLAETKSLIKELRSDGGYAITHTGVLRRTSGRRFSAQTAVRQLESLGHALSFIRGGMTYPILLVGEDGGGTPVWYEWNPRLLSSAVFRFSWFDPTKAHSISRLVPSVMARLSEVVWSEPLRRAVLLYVEANRTPRIEVQTALAQAALELLAWATLVLDIRSVSAKEFDDWSAGRRIRELLSAASIATAVPKELGALAAMSGPPATAEGPERVAYARNRFLHPPRNAPSWPSNAAAMEAAMLAMDYVEQAIFFVTGYHGEYRSRVVRSVVTFP